MLLIGEALALEPKDVDSDEGVIRVLSGKGGKPREVYLTDTALEAVAAWLEARGDAPGPA